MDLGIQLNICATSQTIAQIDHKHDFPHFFLRFQEQT